MEKGIKWSHSGLKDFEGCARRYHEVKVLKKYPFTDTVYTIYGKQVHESAELYIRDGTPLPPEHLFMREVLDALIAKDGRKLTEYEMGVTKDIAPCAFNAPDVWARGIADLLIIDDDNLLAWVVDYKTGGDKYPDTDQLVLMSLMVFAHFPHIREVKSGLLFVIKNSMTKYSMRRDEAALHWVKYRARVGRLEGSFTHDVWNPTKSGLCKAYCPVLTCEFNGRV